MSKLSGIRLDIYKRQGCDWSNGGFSSHYDEATLLLEGGGPVEPSLNAPAVKVVPGHVWGTILAVVVDPETGERLPGGSMMGGCYVASSDSRFSEACERALWESSYSLYPTERPRRGLLHFYGAVALHDRYER